MIVVARQNYVTGCVLQNLPLSKLAVRTVNLVFIYS